MSKKLCLIVSVFFITKIFSQVVDAVDYAWHHQLYSAPSPAKINFVEADDAGNTYTVGEFAGNTDFDPGPGTVIHTAVGGTDAFITKKSPTGQHLWTRVFGNANNDTIFDVDIDNATNPNIYILGSFTGTMTFDAASGTTYTSATNSKYVMKISSNNVHVFTNIVFAETNVTCRKMAVRPSGAMLFVGTFTNQANFDPNGFNQLSATVTNEMYLLELTSSFIFNYARQWALVENDNSLSIDTHPTTGAIDIIGNFRSSKDFDPSATADVKTAFNATIGSMFHLRLSALGQYLNGGVINTTITKSDFKYDNIADIHCSVIRLNNLVVGSTTYTQNFASVTMIKIRPSISGVLNVFVLNSLLPDQIEGFDLFIDVTGNQRIYIWANVGANVGPYTIYGNMFTLSLNYVPGAVVKHIGYLEGADVRITPQDNIYLAGWYDAPATIDPDDSTVVFTPNGSTGYLIKYNYCEVLTTTTNPNEIGCVGDNIVFTNTTTNPGPYIWTGPNGYTDSVMNASVLNVDVNDAGLYSAYNPDANCKYDKIDITLVVNNLPVITTPASVSPSNTVCVNDNVTLNVNALSPSTYSWTGPNGFTSNLQAPTFQASSTLFAGTYNVTVTDNANGCSLSSTAANSVTLNVNPLPVLPAAISASPNDTICSGTSLTLNAPNVSNVNYYWSGPGSFSSSVQNPTIPTTSTSNTGTYNVTIVNTTTGCVMAPSALASVAVVVNPFPVLSTGVTAAPSNIICSGDQLNLNAPTVPNVSYSWTGPNGFISSSQNPVLTTTTVASGGSYTVVLTNNTTGCQSAATPFSSVNVTVNPLPSLPSAVSVSPNDTICAGGNLTFTSPTVNNVVYVWNGPNGFASATPTATVFNATSAATGTYNLNLVSTTTGCAMGNVAFGNINAVVNALPTLPSSVTASPSNTVCQGTSVTLNAPTVSNASYTWTGPGFFSNQQNALISNIQSSGTYTLSIIDTTTACSMLPTPLASTTINVNGTPTYTTLGAVDDTVCYGEQIILQANAGANIAYSWTGPNGFTSNNQNPMILISDTTMIGTYYVQATDTVTGCFTSTVSDSVLIFVHNPQPVVSAIFFPPIICDGGSFILSGVQSGNNTYLWTGPGGYTSTQATDTVLVAGIANQGLYTLTVTNVSTQCSVSLSDSSSTLLTVHPLPNVNYLILEDTLCTGDDLTGTAITQMNEVAIWSDGTNLYQTNNLILNDVDLSNSGNYTVFVSDSVTGCYDSSNFVITVNVTPIVNLDDSLFICGNQLDLSGYDLYTWSNGSTSNPVTFDQSGTYSVIIDSAGCISNSESFYVSLYESGLSAATPSKICIDGSLFLEAIYNQNGSTFLWNLPSGGTSTNPYSVAVVAPSDLGNYIGILNNTQYQCADTITISVALDETGSCFLLPEIITPNGDNQNDNWVLNFIDNYPDNEVFIFNRWGTRVFYMKNYDNSFSGQANVGTRLDENDLPTGTYYYKVIYGENTKTGFIEINK